MRIDVCPKLFATNRAHNFTEHPVPAFSAILQGLASFGEAYGLMGADRFACVAAIYAICRMGDDSLSFHYLENAVWAETNAAGSFEFFTSIASVRKDGRKPSNRVARHLAINDNAARNKLFPSLNKCNQSSNLYMSSRERC